MELPEGLGQRIGILGGTFDPVHNGHLAIAVKAKGEFGLDSFLFIPAHQPPHKPDYIISSFKDRVAMLECAIGKQSGFFVSRLEANRPGPSYSIDTLTLLRQQLGSGINLFFTIGMDSFAEIMTWKTYERLLRLTDFIVADRPDQSMGGMAEIIKQYFPLHHYDEEQRAWVAGSGFGSIYSMHISVPVSATEIRARVQAGRPIDDLVPEGVARYIAKHGLYKDGASR